jgi:hypothetical protein
MIGMEVTWSIASSLDAQRTPQVSADVALHYDREKMRM